jgi:dTDP-4-dehydrorhamnose 3,5-epimerase
VEELGIGGAWVYTPRVWPDQRGQFFELFRGQEFAHDLGYRLEVAQANYSVSRRGVIRGVHFADVPPGQAKYVSCVHGRILDVVVDLRVGSPTFQRWEAVELDDAGGRSLFLAEGLGHAFTPLDDEATVIYLCSTGYAPQAEHGVHPLDPDIAIAWPAGADAVLSAKDATAPGLAEALRSGLLPSYEACLARARSLRGTP